jgi:hypothetical protein
LESHIISLNHRGVTISKTLLQVITEEHSKQPLREKLEKDNDWTANITSQVAWEDYRKSMDRDAISCWMASVEEARIKAAQRRDVVKNIRKQT